MVAEYLARGGIVRKLPEARPHTADDVVRYLREQDVAVEMKDTGGKRPEYALRGEPISFERLLNVANRHRRRHNFTPFEVTFDRLN
jgi:hypothetical protein